MEFIEFNGWSSWTAHIVLVCFFSGIDRAFATSVVLKKTASTILHKVAEEKTAWSQIVCWLISCFLEGRLSGRVLCASSVTPNTPTPSGYSTLASVGFSVE